MFVSRLARRRGHPRNAISDAEQNVPASLDHAPSLPHAKDVTEAMRPHSEYVKAQMRSLAGQASEMGQMAGPGRRSTRPGGKAEKKLKAEKLFLNLQRLFLNVFQPELAFGRGLLCGIAP
jgi:hypothetical protein